MSTQTQERLLQALQALSSILIQLNALRTLTNEASEDTLPALQKGLDTLEQITRDVIYIIRSTDDEPLAELEGVTLADALSHLVEEAAERLGLSSRITFSGVDEQKRRALSTTTERILYLIVREALFQIQQHTDAHRLRFGLNYGQEEVQMSIEDDGLIVGQVEDEEPSYDLPAPPLAAVLPSIVPDTTPVINDLRHRIAQLGGALEVDTSGERGIRFLARAPYAPHVTEEQALEQTKTISAPTISSEQVSVLIVDNHAVTRAGMRRLLETYPGIQVIGEAADGVQAVSETLELGPRVVLIDTQLPGGQSLEALRQIKQLNLDTRVLLLSVQDREEYLYETLRAGADGYVLKDIAPDELVQAIQSVARGEVLIQPQLASKLLSRFGKQGRNGVSYEALTARELEVLRLLARGLRNKEMAARLYVSERTVNFHLANIYQKLNVSGRTEALSKALEQGLITA